MRYFIFVLLPLTVLADDIHYKNGCIVTNLTIKDSTGAFYQAETTQGKPMGIKKSLVDRVISAPVDGPTRVINCPEIQSSQHEKPQLNATGQQIKFNITALATAVGFSVLAYDSFKDAGQYEKQIDYYRSYNDLVGTESEYYYDTSGLVEERDRKKLMGFLFIAVAVFNGINAWETVQVSASSNSLNLTLHL